jgi:hypothetical protein
MNYAMVTRAAPTEVDPSATQSLSRSLERIATKKIWLPKLLYDSLPFFYLAAGISAFFAALYISEWFWVVPQYILFSAACLHLSFAVYRRRRKPETETLAETGVFAAADPRR